MKTSGAAEYVTLPSLGKIYACDMSKEILLDSMETRHELQRLAPSDLPYKPLCDILDDCIKSEIPMSTYDLCLGDWQFLLYKLRAVTYGSALKLNVRCPICLEEHEIDIDLDTFEIINKVDEIDDLLKLTLPRSNSEITLKLQTPRGLDIMANRLKEYKARRKGMAEDPTLLFSIENCIAKVDEQRLNEDAMREWIRNLPMMDTNMILNASKILNEAIGVDNNIPVRCKGCGHTFTSQFKVTPEFFRPTTS